MAADRHKFLKRAEDALRESKHVDFKREFDLASGEAWCELIKDIVAFANSGGGVIVFGVGNDGKNVTFDAVSLFAYDTADISNRIARYTGNQLVEVEVIEIKRDGETRAGFIVADSDVPIVFTKPGTYDVGGGKQKTAFGQGTIYFRHGSKSEPGNRDDLAAWRDREIEKVRKSWMGGIRKVVRAAASDTITVVSPGREVPRSGPVIKAKVSSDASAVSFVPGNAGEIWPHRQKSLITLVNKQLAKEDKINTHDIYCIKRVFDIVSSRPDFAYKPHPDASPQYSGAFGDWMVSEYKKDKTFFKRIRSECRAKLTNYGS